MIFYFTGTGNSLWVAKKLGEELHETLVSIAEAIIKKEFVYTPEPEEKLLFIFPIHSWGLPVLVHQFMKRLEIQGYAGQFVYAVCTCGDDCGITNKVLGRLFHFKGLPLHAVFSIQMPNNYILLPGFDVDEKSVEQKKLKNAEEYIYELSEMLMGKRTMKQHYLPGKFAVLKTRLVYPLFARFSVGKTSFYATEACISCGLCAKVCPTRTISFQGDKPVWERSCVQCLACIHRCPVRAIEWGKETRKKGRYHHPGLK